MSWFFSALCILLFIAGLVAAVVKVSRQHRHNRPVLQRQAELLPQWAARHGFTYAPQDDRVLSISARPPLAEMNAFTEKQSDGLHKLHWGQVSATWENIKPAEWIRAEHVMNGRPAGRQTVVFQYHLRPEADEDIDGVGSLIWHWLVGRHIKRKMQDVDQIHRTVVAVRLPRSTPFLAVSPQPPGTKLVQGWALRDMDTELHAFNERFLVHSQHDRFSTDVLHPRMIEWMMDEPLLRDRSSLGRNGFVLDNGWCYMMGMTALDVDLLDAQLALLEGFVGRIPAHVWAG